MVRTSELEESIPLQIEKSVEKTGKTRFNKNRTVFYALLFLFVLGMMYGSILLKGEGGGVFNSLASIQDAYIAQRSAQPVWNTIFSSAASSGIFFLGTFLLGFSAIGQPFTFFIAFVKGLGIGSSIGYLYLHYGVTGIGYSLLLVIPSAVISMFALILSARESVRLSNSLLLSFFYERNKLSKAVFQLYLLKHLILFGFILGSALLDGILTFLFSGMFQFG